MSVTIINIPQTFRSWRAAGLTHLLADRPVAEIAAVIRHAGSEPCADAAARLPREIVTDSGSSPLLPVVPIIAKTISSPTEAASQPGSWPAAWQGIFGNTKPAPLVWSYAELGLDLSGCPSSERRDLMQRLIAGMRLQRGTSAFWPSALPASDSAGTLVPNPHVFFAGLELLSPRLVVLFGRATLEDAALDPELLPPMHQAVIRGKLFVHAPAVAELLQPGRSVDVLISLLRAVADTLRLEDIFV